LASKGFAVGAKSYRPGRWKRDPLQTEGRRQENTDKKQTGVGAVVW
jgi:hypothetical protein